MDDKRQLGEEGKLEPSLKQSIGLGLVLFSLNVWEAHFKKENSNNKVKSSLMWANRPGASRAKSWVSPRSDVVPWETVSGSQGQCTLKDSEPWGRGEMVDTVRECITGTVHPGGQWTLGDNEHGGTVDSGGQCKWFCLSRSIFKPPLHWIPF